VFALRPAPVQLSWMGSVGTTGLRAMDGIIADRFHIPPGAEQDYVERVWRLPDSFLCYTPPDYAPAVADLPARRTGAITFGCFSNPAKINGPLLAVWAEILRRLPGSRLLLKYRWMDSPANRDRIIAAMAAAGVDGERLIIEGESKHAELLSRYNDVDIALDTSPYSGGGTTLEALWMGVPVITRPVPGFAGRHSFSFLSVLGLDDLIARTPEDYVTSAVALAEDDIRLSELRRTLRPRLRASALCDTPRFTKNLESIYAQTVP
jgi:protein O-GlcNAc transferase